MRSRSSVVVPGRLPWSRSACRTQLDSVCAVQPILAAIDTIAAHCDVSSVRCSNTIPTARSRTSAETFGASDSFVMTPVSQELEPPANPGRSSPVIVAFLTYGAIEAPDSGGYISYAEQLRSGNLPTDAALLKESPEPISLYRTPGYPALIAVTQSLFGTAWKATLVLLQIIAHAALA